MVDFSGYAFSFSHAIITMNGVQYTGIGGVSINQDLDEGAVYGTSYKPLKRSAGRLQMGRGRLTFSDYEEGAEFFSSLGVAPFLSIFELSYVLNNPDGGLRVILCNSCRLTGFSVDHQATGEALNSVYPFSFLDMLIDGIPFSMSPQAIAKLGLRAAGAAVQFLP